LRSARAQRRVREKEARRRSILDAAAAVFLEWGIHASTMDQVAERAELSKGALYLYFRSKQEIGLALLVEASRRLNAELKQVHAPDAPPFEQLQRLIEAYYDFSVRRPDYFRLLFVVEHEPYRGRIDETVRAEWTALGKEALELLAGVIEHGIKAGAIRRCDPWTTAVSLWASVTGVMVLPAQEVRWDFLGHLDVEELVRSTLQTFWEGLSAEPPVRAAARPKAERKRPRQEDPC
jgi:AcrR family transcriptional regulator